jgi:hypothetical protein
MLPSFRFLFAAIVLSMSILVFGLGAAALLRVAHEEFASIPWWHATPETVFAQQSETPNPVLAMLRVEAAPAEPKAADNVANAAAPAAIVSSPAEPATTASVPAEPEQVAALKPEGVTSPEAATTEIQAADSPTPSEATPALADTPAPADPIAIANSEQVAPSVDVSSAPLSDPVAPESTAPTVSPEAAMASTRIATLGGPPVTIEAQPREIPASAKSDSGAIKKHHEARRAGHRHRTATRVAQEAAQQQADPFVQPTITVRRR